MIQIFVVCTCGMPNAIGGLDPELLAMLKSSSSRYFCSNCGKSLSNATAFAGEWHKTADGHFEVHEK